MEKLNVVVLYGGYSSEHEVSKRSAATIIANLSEENYNVIPIYISKEGQWFLHDGSVDTIRSINIEKFAAPTIISPDRTSDSLLRIVGNKVKNIPVDIVFPVLHGKFGEDGTIQGLLELSGIPYVGCGVLASALAMDKYYTKIIAEKNSVEQANYISFREDDIKENLAEITKQIRYQIGYPCFVKPANAGSSVGITKAKNKKEVESAIEFALKHDNKIIVEEAIIGRELECSVLGSGKDDTIASCVGEILPSSDFYDYDAKYNSSESKTLVPADIPDDISEKIREAAIKVFKAIDGSGLARVDFFWDEKKNKIIFNEINTMPGFTSISMYPMLWEAVGLSISDLLDKLIDLGFYRNTNI